MKDFIDYLSKHLNLYGFTLLKINLKKAVIFKTFSKFTKCIYINIIDNKVEVNIDRVFDLKGIYPDNIERLIISKNLFNNIEESFEYIQKNIAI